jgi:hypothetical protein
MATNTQQQAHKDAALKELNDKIAELIDKKNTFAEACFIKEGAEQGNF